jgi:two-component system, NtrC family, response regulator AtoC
MAARDIRDARALIVDDDPAMGRMVGQALTALKVEAIVTTNVADALTRFDAEDFDVVITDLRMAGASGLDLCEHVMRARDDVPVIVATAFGSMQTAVEALRAGAFDFVTKPFDLEVLRATVVRALDRRRLELRVRRLEVELDAARRSGPILGRSPAMAALLELIDRVADSTATVLVTGESGTGKELVARSLHDKSRRHAGPFVALNCAAMPASLLEAELFGHVRGAFTDARADRDGLLTTASGGTLFLDEIGELPIELQPKLLRALQERTVRPIGGSREKPFDARVVTATNVDLEAAVAEGRFRADLYYRLHVVDLPVPPLRVRGNDVLLLAGHFLSQFAAASGKPIERLSRAAIERLLAYSWPGNVRELQNCLERAVALCRFSEIGVEDLPERVREGTGGVAAPELPADALVPLEEIERRYVLHVFKTCGENKSLAAKILGLNRKTLYRKLARYGVAVLEEPEDG